MLLFGCSDDDDDDKTWNLVEPGNQPLDLKPSKTGVYGSRGEELHLMPSQCLKSAVREKAVPVGET